MENPLNTIILASILPWMIETVEKGKCLALYLTREVCTPVGDGELGLTQRLWEGGGGCTLESPDTLVRVPV